MADEESPAKRLNNAYGGPPPPPKFNSTSPTSKDDVDCKAMLPPPPPKFTATAAASPPFPPPPRAVDPVKAAATAAAKAAQHATPAQPERIIMEATAHALAQQQQLHHDDDEKTTTTPKLQPLAGSAYHPPEWSGIPQNVPYTLEVMKQGTIVATIDLKQLFAQADRGYLTLGRTPDNNVVLDHPSSSRLHAILQFREEDGAAFLFDPGSTHGCYVNKSKARIAAGQYIPIHVGDMLRFGESSRVYILCGPAELMVEEGPSREQRRQAAALEALRRRKEKDAAAAELEMARAIAGGGGASGGGGVSWGFQEDARDSGDDDDENDGGRKRMKSSGGGGYGVADDIDWRHHAATKGLSEKQQKLADKIRKREARVGNLQREAEKIEVKRRSMEEMSVGQANTLAKNEQDIQNAMIEIEELEDQLEDSIRASLGGGKKKNSKKKVGGGAKKRKKRDSDDDGDARDGNSDEDSFYDRTTLNKGGSGRKGHPHQRRRRRSNNKDEDGGAEDAASLYGKLETLKEEKTRVDALLQAEMAAAAHSNGDGSKGRTISPPRDDKIDKIDVLDDFMKAVDASLETERGAALRAEVVQLEEKIKRTEWLLKVADPDGYYKAGSKAAEIAVQRARRAMQIEQQRREAEHLQREREAAAKAAAKAAFIEEKEEEDAIETEMAAKTTVHQLAPLGVTGTGKQQQQQQPDVEHDDEEEKGGLEIFHRPPPSNPPPLLQPLLIASENISTTNAAAPAALSPSPAIEQSTYQKRRAEALESSLAGGKITQRQQEGTQKSGRTNNNDDDATAQVLADLALLQQAKRGCRTDADGGGEEKVDREEDKKKNVHGEEEGYVWQPPQEQTGDGRTVLNDKLGY